MEGDNPFTAARMNLVAQDLVRELREQEEKEAREFAQGEWLRLQKLIVDQAAKGGFSIQVASIRPINEERLINLGFQVTSVIAQITECRKISWQ